MSNALASTTRPFALVVGVNLTDQASSGYALDQGLRIAARIAGSEVHVVHVVGDGATAESSNEAAGLLRIYVSEKAAALGVVGPQATGIHVCRGDAASAIAQLAADIRADMIVVGTHKAPTMKALFVGSTAERLLGHAECPVFVAGPRPSAKPSHLVVIEPPCPDCVEARGASGGRTWWCARHSENHHLRRHHVYSYSTELSFAEHDSEVSPTGVD
jgi:nucleotide-binding universal stress UspA family protein